MSTEEGVRRWIEGEVGRRGKERGGWDGYGGREEGDWGIVEGGKGGCWGKEDGDENRE